MEMFEIYEVDVIYVYDRLNKTQPDRYWAEIEALGLQFWFDENQNFDTLYVSFSESREYEPLASLAESIQIHNYFSEMPSFSERSNALSQHGETDVWGEPIKWIRLDHPGMYIHYQFSDHILEMITFGRKDD